jgi:hypothetical protein
MDSGEPPNNERSSLPNPEDLLAMEEDEFRAAFGERLEDTLNLDTWRPGEDLAEMYQRLEQEVAEAVGQEAHLRERIRAELFPYVFTRRDRPANAGCYRVQPAMLERIQRGLLFNGAVEACDGTCQVHDALPMTLTQIGVSLVSYQGDQGTWLQRLYRRDLRISGFDPIAEAMALLERRKKRDGVNADHTRDKLSELTRRGIMAYAERAILLHKSQALWRMGHGNPMPLELLTGGGLVIQGDTGGDMPLLRQSLSLWRDLLIKHRKWVFVSSAPADRVVLTLGDALYPLEFALVGTPTQMMRDIVDEQLPHGLAREARQFVDEIGDQIVVGIYRASPAAPPYVFYAHRDHAPEAALIVMADSVLQEHRGFPMLIDLADTICRVTFGPETFKAAIQLAYAEAGEPFRYLGERETRRW